MSIARQLLREFRPLFRMLDESFGHSSGYYLTPTGSRHRERNQLFVDPFTGPSMLDRPAVDVMEKGNSYVLDADLPGVSSKNLQVRLGDGNQSVTIEGKVTETSGIHNSRPEIKAEASSTISPAENTDASHSTSAAANGGDITQISVERPYTRNYSFTRTVRLPRPVNPNTVVAKLQNGVLSVSLEKAIDDESKIIKIAEA